jgi:hypothetical protein
VTKQVRDKWGRWVCQEFQGRADRKVVIISAYQPVVNTSTLPGKITVIAQQKSLLIKENAAAIHPRTAFRNDLSTCLKQYQSKEVAILLVGDFNEALGTDPDGMTQIAGKYGLIDLTGSRHPTPPPATYARGSKRLDYALASPLIAAAMEYAGYEAFNSRLVSDHRGYFIDFDTKKLFGAETQTLASRTNRGLASNNPVQVTAYIRQKHALLSACNAFNRANRLQHQGNRHQYAERLDKDMLHASLTAEQRIPKFETPAWSQELARARQLVVVLKKQLAALRSGIDHQRILKLATQTLVPQISIPTEYKECSALLRQTKIEINEIIKTSFARRDDERNQKNNDLEKSAKTADKESAVRLRRLKKAEDLKALFAKLRSVQTEGARKGVTSIEIPKHPDEDPKSCTEWVQVDVPTEVLQHLQKRNQAHFGHAKGTPFTTPPLVDHLGYRGDGWASKQILNGTYDHTDYEENVQLLLRHLHYVHEMAQDGARPTISSDEFESKLRVWTESTTTSPSGLHLGHFKSLIARLSFSSNLPDEDLTADFVAQRTELNVKQQDLFEFHLTMINYALERGYSFSRWQTIANTILFKDPDNVRIHRTRVIHIYEADFNLALEF